jgi:hypothetical protein
MRQVVPEPNDDLLSEYHSKGTSIGDVSIITPDGSFDFIFNICIPASNPVNCFGVPDGFKVDIGSGDISLKRNMHLPGSDISSTHVVFIG